MPTMQKVSSTQEWDRPARASRPAAQPTAARICKGKPCNFEVIEQGSMLIFRVTQEGAAGAIFERQVPASRTEAQVTAAEDGIVYTHLSGYTNKQIGNSWRRHLRMAVSEIITRAQ